MKVTSILRNLLLFGTVVVLAGCRGNMRYLLADNSGSGGTDTGSGSGSGSSGASAIKVTGKLIWHSYTQYGFTGVQSWMANFDTGKVAEITPPKISGAMNYHFNQDGTEVVFMGSDDSFSNQAWDIWVASVTPTGLDRITKITSGSSDGSRNEDPKFSSDGTQIIFKKNLHYICSIDTSSFSVDGTPHTPPVTELMSNTYETSMPYYLLGSDTNFVFTDNATSNSTIQYNNGGTVTTLYAPSGVHAYYPIALSATQFYFSESNPLGHDQIELGDTRGSVAIGAAFNIGSYENADPFPMDPNWMAYTSTRPGGAGGYDIWVGNFNTGETYNLNAFIPNANRTNDDLGPAFFGTINGGSISGGAGSGGSGSIPGGGTNLVTNGTATASSSYDGYPASNAIDGDTSSRWCALDGSMPQWWMVDLGANYAVSQVSLSFYPADGWKFQIQGSTDGSTFTTLVDKSTNTSSISSGTYTIPNAVVRYIRVYFTGPSSGGNWASLQEVVVNGLPATSTLDLSTGKPASASSDDGTHLASWANDGSTSTVWGAGDGSFPQWWKVDLGSTHVLTQVEVDFFPTNAPDVWHFVIEGSTDGANFTTLVDQSNNTSRLATGTYTLSNVSARYVRVTFTSGTADYNWAALAEVKVTGY